MSVGFLAPLALAALAFMASITGGPPPMPTVRPLVKIVDVRGAAAMVARGAAVLDARDAAAYAAGHLPGAQLYSWQNFTGRGSQRGKLRPDLEELARTLASLGIDNSRPALIYGAAGHGWGEEGHAAWLLALLGHPDIGLLDGGFSAWRAAGRPVVTTTSPPRTGRFSPNLRADLRVLREHITKSTQVIDARSALEFAGATPSGESRGGHLPQAKHLDWRSLLDENGRVRSAARLQKVLEDAGIDPARELVLYCTAGVRSAFAAIVLNARGVAHVRNYDGSMLEWCADPEAPLEH